MSLSDRLAKLERLIGAGDDDDRHCEHCGDQLMGVKREDDGSYRCVSCGGTLARLPAADVKVYVGCSPIDWDEPPTPAQSERMG